MYHVCPANNKKKHNSSLLFDWHADIQNNGRADLRGHLNKYPYPCCILYLHVIHYIATIVDSRTCSHSYTNIPFLHVFLNVNYFCQFIYSMATVKIFFTWITVKLSSVIYRVINFMRQLIILVVSIGIACLLQVVVFFIRIITCWSIINLLCYPVKLLF